MLSHDAIQTDGLSKTYRPARRGAAPRVAVDGLTLTVRRGDVFGFLGANGAGKTTTVKMLLGFHAPTSGTAALLGRSTLDPAARRRVGYLPEQPYFPRFLSAGETVRMHARLAGLGRKAAPRAADDCLARVGMAAHERTPLAKLSKGMTQRVALAAALVGDPALLVLDEPASGLDPIGRREMVALLRELAAEGRTIFLSSHFLSEVESLCSHVAVLKAGRLVAQGTPAEIACRNAGRVCVTATGLSPLAEAGLLARLGSDGTVREAASEENTLRLLVPDADVYSVLAALDAAGATLVSAVPARETLEAAFFRLAGDEDDGGINYATGTAAGASAAAFVSLKNAA